MISRAELRAIDKYNTMITKKDSAPVDNIPQVISYLTLRKGVGILGISLPIILVIGSIVCGDCQEIQSSISSYYYTNMRNIFVGIICAVAFFLFSYKGYDRRDDMAGDLACLFALGVAFFPTSITEPLSNCIPEPVDTKLLNKIHFISAALFFLTLSYFSLVLFTKGSSNPTGKKKERNMLYRICGYVMISSIAMIALYCWVLEEYFPVLHKFDPIFWLEVIALWAFGISWLTKGKAILFDIENNIHNNKD